MSDTVRWTLSLKKYSVSIFHITIDTHSLNGITGNTQFFINILFSLVV